MRVFSALFKVLIIVVATAIISQRSSAQNPESENNKPLKIQRINSPVKLDGLSNEAAWDGIKSLPIVMRMPNFGNEPSETTAVFIGYDDDYIYIAGRLYDSEPSKIQAASLDRDGGWKLNFHNKTQRTIQDLALLLNPKIRGWLNYYGKINRRCMRPVFLLSAPSHDKMGAE